MRSLLTLAAIGAAGTPVLAQGTPFQTPGMPAFPSAAPDTGQSDRFTSAFNPAFSFIVDVLVDWLDADDPAAEDGFDAELRSFELAANAWVDPNAWAYFVGALEEESLAIEEAAIHYTGLGGNHTIRAGRFFVDFGKQMQFHVHELRTLERPLALRAYLGEEVKGDGLQWDYWVPVGEHTVVRWSLGAFADLLPEEEEFPSSDSAGEPLVKEIDDRKDAGDFNFTARLTGFTDLSESSVLQVGASLRALPDYTLVDEADGLSEEGLSNEVIGLDLTYGWTDETGQRKLTLGGEFLASTGDNAALVDDPDATPGSGDESLLVADDTRMGWFAFGDYAFNPYNSAGLQVSAAELQDSDETDATEIEGYFTHWFSEYHRLRLSVISADVSGGDDDLRVVATLPDLADVAREIGGDRVEVQSLYRGKENTHALTARPSHLVAMSKADLFVQVGLSLESALVPGLLQNARNPRIAPRQPGFVTVSAGWEAIQVPTELSRKAGDVHPQGNPHMNLDPRAGEFLADRILAGLVGVDPGSEPAYRSRHAAYVERVKEARARWDEMGRQWAGARIVVYHQEYDYLALYHGLVVDGKIEPKPGIPPTPNHVAALIETMRASGTAAIVTAIWSNDSTVARIHEATGVPVVEVPNMCGGLPGTETWIGMMDVLHRRLDAVLRESKRE